MLVLYCTLYLTEMGILNFVNTEHNSGFVRNNTIQFAAIKSEFGRCSMYDIILHTLCYLKLNIALFCYAVTL